MTPKQLAEEAADKSWGIAGSGKGMMQHAVEAALNAYSKAYAEEFRRLAAQKRERRKMAEDCGAMDIALELLHKENTWFQAAQMLEERLLESPTTQPPSSEP